MIGCRNTIPHSEHWYSAAPSASQTVSTIRRRTPSWPNGHGTSATGAAGEKSANGLGGDRGPGRGDGGERPQVVAGGGDERCSLQHGSAEVLQDRHVGDVVLRLVLAIGGAHV